MARPRIRKAWNGGSSAAALAAAQRRTDAAIAAGCPRCACCGGDGGVAKRLPRLWRRGIPGARRRHAGTNVER
jgi:hypothetical protein